MFWFISLFYSRGLGIGQISGPDYCLRRGRKRHQFNETIVNCTQSQCSSFADKNRVEVENIKVEFEQKGGHISDCSQVLDSGYFISHKSTKN